MQIDKAFESSIGMNEADWARHANPWSVYTRIPLLALIALSIFSRAWIDWWAVFPLVILLAWVFYNPRAFSAPASTDNWASKVTLGERLWLNRKTVPVPASHARWALGLSIAGGVALLPMIYGLYVLDPFAAGLGAALASVLKLWFCDRMVWLYEDMAG
ncbi:DUF6653 family protein [Oricola nitratireducens]|uniref:DUF6653 family protein n=1 Tax=Oricola nitratireducens TaxID=2775868 RepID=UPI0018685E32|nr:DUF6653 family protein [Oricola nitratireducens]